MADPLEIRVTYEKDKVTVVPDDATIYFDDPEQPDSVTWIVKNCPEDLNVKISWDLEAPFLLVEEIDLGKRVIGRVNSCEEGIFGYSVLFVDAHNQVRAGCDPRIRNLPHD